MTMKLGERKNYPIGKYGTGNESQGHPAQEMAMFLVVHCLCFSSNGLSCLPTAKIPTLITLAHLIL